MEFAALIEVVDVEGYDVELGYEVDLEDVLAVLLVVAVLFVTTDFAAVALLALEVAFADVAEALVFALDAEDVAA